MILKGRDMVTGGSIIIPMDISVLATTISIMRNGMNSINPLVKARFSSLVIKAGIITSMLMSSTVAGWGRPEIDTNMSMSSG